MLDHLKTTVKNISNFKVLFILQKRVCKKSFTAIKLYLSKFNHSFCKLDNFRVTEKIFTIMKQSILQKSRSNSTPKRLKDWLRSCKDIPK